MAWRDPSFWLICCGIVSAVAGVGVIVSTVASSNQQLDQILRSVLGGPDSYCRLILSNGTLLMTDHQGGTNVYDVDVGIRESVSRDNPVIRATKTSHHHGKLVASCRLRRRAVSQQRHSPTAVRGAG
jgi:hypothetical protein